MNEVCSELLAILKVMMELCYAYMVKKDDDALFLYYMIYIL